MSVCQWMDYLVLIKILNFRKLEFLSNFQRFNF